MIDTKIYLDKNVVKNGENKKDILIKLTGVKVKHKEIKNIKKNIALAIDVSGSMDDCIDKNNFHNFHNYLNPRINNSFQEKQNFNYKTKLQSAKSAAIKLINSLNDGDTVSIVTFSGNTNIVSNCVEINKENKQLLTNSIYQLTAGGGTNMHAGWFEAVKLVANKVEGKDLNRVIVLTDGDTNVGVVDLNTFSNDAQKLANQNITTSTIGFGHDFKEDFLMSFSKAGKGNSYYAKNEESLINILDYELNGVSNIVAKDIEVSIYLNDNKVDINNLNLFNINEKNVLIDCIFAEQEINLVLNAEFISKNETEKLEIKISYKDENKKLITMNELFNLEALSDDKFNNLESNNEVSIQKTLLNIANHKEKSKSFIDSGNISGSANLLNESLSLARAFSADPRIAKEIDNLNQLQDMTKNGETNKLRKNLSYDSYSTRSGINKF